MNNARNVNPLPGHSELTPERRVKFHRTPGPVSAGNEIRPGTAVRWHGCADNLPALLFPPGGPGWRNEPQPGLARSSHVSGVLPAATKAGSGRTPYAWSGNAGQNLLHWPRSR